MKTLISPSFDIIVQPTETSKLGSTYISHANTLYTPNITTHTPEKSMAFNLLDCETPDSFIYLCLWTLGLLNVV